MTTLAAPETREFPKDSIEKQVYGITEELKEYIPIENDRNRLGYCLYKYATGEGDKPEILIKSTKIKVAGITDEELAKKIENLLERIKK